MFKPKSRIISCLQLALVILTAGLTHASETPHAIPFKAAFVADEVATFDGPLHFTVEGEGEGQATHLGRFTATLHREGFVVDASLIASYEFTAANGDKLFVESAGQADLSVPDVHVVETGTVTGGTGRFEGATGTIAIERVVTFTGPTTDTTTHVMEGTIVLPNGN
jgi:hypothetical protein